MRLILSTDGTATVDYMGGSDSPLVSVPQVEDIRKSRWVGESGQHRDTVHVDLSLEQGRALLEALTGIVALAERHAIRTAQREGGA